MKWITAIAFLAGVLLVAWLYHSRDRITHSSATTLRVGMTVHEVAGILGRKPDYETINEQDASAVTYSWTGTRWRILIETRDGCVTLVDDHRRAWVD